MKDSETKFNILSIALALAFLGVIFLQPIFLESKKNISQTSQIINKPFSLEDVASDISRLTPLPIITPAPIKKEEGGDKKTSYHSSIKKTLPAKKYSRNYSPKEFLTAKEAYVFGLDSKKEFFKKNIYLKKPIASLTKLMTALVFYDYFPRGYQVVVSQRAADVEGCFLANLKEGEIFKKEDILYLMLLVSNNQAAYVAQESIPNFLELMNKKAKELGMNSTFYFEPSGLSAKNQSSAYDLAKLVKYIFKNRPEIFNIQKTKSKIICPQKYKTRKDCYHLVNIDFFVNRNDFLGGKTGYTNEAGQCLVSLFKWKEPVGIIVLNSKERFDDTERLLNWLKNNFK